LLEKIFPIFIKTIFYGKNNCISANYRYYCILQTHAKGRKV